MELSLPHGPLSGSGSTSGTLQDEYLPIVPAPIKDTTAPRTSFRASRSVSEEHQQDSTRSHDSASYGFPVHGRRTVAELREQSPRSISWAFADGQILQQPRPRRLTPSLSSLDRQAWRLSNHDLSPTSPNQTLPRSNTDSLDRTDTMYRQSNKSHTSLMKSWTKRLERDGEKDHRRSRSLTGLPALRANNHEQSTSASRPASANLPPSKKDTCAPRVRPPRRFSWQKKATDHTSEGDWHPKEGPLVFVPAAALASVTEEAVKHSANEDDDDDESDAETVIHRPSSPEPLPFRPCGFAGELPRYYELANEMATVPPPSSALGVVFPGDQVEQLRAEMALVRLELAKKEEQLARTKEELGKEKVEREKVEREKVEREKVEKERDRAMEQVRKLEEENRRMKRGGVVKRTEMTVEEKWWNW